MGSGEYNNLKYYMQDVDTGEMTELHGITEIADTELHEIPKSNMFSVDMTATVDMTPAEIYQFMFRFFPDRINNWRKQHRLCVLRRKHIYNKRWYGKIHE